MKRVLFNSFILLFLIKLVFSESLPECPLYTWQCKNGQCIKSDDLCDGNYDCDDKSDETVEECLLRPCPGYAFQCAYGACITGNFKCNGVINCVDGSDETRYLCQPQLNYEKEMQGNCGLPDSMECKPGECISNERLCDGRNDCTNGSDETVEVCSFLRCPEYAFRCGYGACVTGSYACDGVKNCRDGSDEIASICSNITGLITTTFSPVPQAPKFTTAKPTILDSSTVSSLHPSSTVNLTALDNHCSSAILMQGISTVASCYYYNKLVSCYRDIRIGTIANDSCAPGYIERHMKHSCASIQCDADGEWTCPKRKCIPECGTLTEEQKNSPSAKPWDVTIFRRDYAPIFMPICSGVIVSPKIALTAANCFLSYNNAYYTDHIFYNLVEGFHNESYYMNDKLRVQVHNVSSISIKNIHPSQDLAVLVVVNYFQFSHVLKPICLPTAQSNVFPFYNENKLNIGRPIIRDTSKIYLEYLISSIENKNNGRKDLTYVNIYNYIPFIHREIKKYDYLL